MLNLWLLAEFRQLLGAQLCAVDLKDLLKQLHHRHSWHLSPRQVLSCVWSPRSASTPYYAVGVVSERYSLGERQTRTTRLCPESDQNVLLIKYVSGLGNNNKKNPLVSGGSLSTIGGTVKFPAAVSMVRSRLSSCV
jgi:hypothetical protein